MDTAQAPIAREPLDTRRIALFLVFAYGIAWAFGLITYLTGGIANSPQLIPGVPITLAMVLVATGYMWAPALAHILTRLITHEGWRDTFLRPRLVLLLRLRCTQGSQDRSELCRDSVFRVNSHWKSLHALTPCTRFFHSRRCEQSDDALIRG